MRLFEHTFLADENVAPRTVAELRSRGVDVVTVKDIGLKGAPDVDVLAYAVRTERVALTHDADFGTLALREGASFVGIVYLRPGNLDPVAVVRCVDALAKVDIDFATRFIVVAELRASDVRIRYRPVRVL